MSLVSCPRCDRHIRAGEACPFCARRGRVLVAGLLGLGLAACTPPVAAVYGGPPEPAPEPPEAGVVDAAPPSTPVAPPSAPATQPDPRPDTPMPLYGGPPGRSP